MGFKRKKKIHSLVGHKGPFTQLNTQKIISLYIVQDMMAKLNFGK